MKAMIAVLTAFLTVIGAHAEEAKFVVAIKSEQNAETSLDHCRWNLEIGETFPLVRYMSKSEFAGGPEDDSDATYAVLRLDSGCVIVKSESVAVVPSSDTVKAAMAYRQIVEQFRASRAAYEQKQVQQQADAFAESCAQQKETEKQAKLETQRLAQEQAQIQEEEVGAFRPQTFFVSYAIYPARDVQYNDGFILRRGTQLSAKWDRQADSFSYIDSNGTPRQLPARLARETPTHRMQTDPRREAYVQRRDQAVMRGASTTELNQIESIEELQQIRTEIERLRQDIPFRGRYRYH